MIGLQVYKERKLTTCEHSGTAVVCQPVESSPYPHPYLNLIMDTQASDLFKLLVGGNRDK